MNASKETGTSDRIPLSRVIGWALYDWANTGYAMIGLAFLFPMLYSNFWASGLPKGQQAFWFGLTVSAGSLLVALLAPFMASIAERTGRRKGLLLTFAGTGMLACASLTFLDQGLWVWASLVHIIAMSSFYLANLFYDSMLEAVSTPKNRSLISGIGFSTGYFSGLLIIGIIALVNLYPSAFGGDALFAKRFLFVIAALWWGLFTLPFIFTFPNERHEAPVTFSAMLREAVRKTADVCIEIYRTKPVFWFLIAYLCYIDGVNTIITSASNLATTLKFTEMDILTAFTLVQVAGVPCAVAFGLLGKKFGVKPILLCAMAIYVLVTLYGARLTVESFTVFGIPVREIHFLALGIGLVQGGVQALSRSFFADLCPADKRVSFFGFYSMIGKSAAVLGPLLFGGIALLVEAFAGGDGDPLLATRLGFASISTLFLAGGLFLLKVKQAS